MPALVGARRQALFRKAASGTVPYSETTADPGSQGLTAGTTYLNRGLTVDNGATILTMGIHATGARTIIVKIGLRVSPGIYDIVVSQSYSHPGGGWVDVTLSSPYVVPGTGDYYAGANISGTVGLIPTTDRAINAADVTGTGVSMTEANGSTVGVRFSGTKPA